MIRAVPAGDDTVCYSCEANSGKRRISPGPTIHEGEYWLVEHAYPCKMTGWLVLVLTRHSEALHDLTEAELSELALLTRRAASALRETLGCEKEYVACFSEAPHFKHVHFHVIARAADLPANLRGTAIFDMLKAGPADAVPPGEIAKFCERLQPLFR